MGTRAEATSPSHPPYRASVLTGQQPDERAWCSNMLCSTVPTYLCPTRVSLGHRLHTYIDNPFRMLFGLVPVPRALPLVRASWPGYFMAGEQTPETLPWL